MSHFSRSPHLITVVNSSNILLWMVLESESLHSAALCRRVPFLFFDIHPAFLPEAAQALCAEVDHKHLQTQPIQAFPYGRGGLLQICQGCSFISNIFKLWIPENSATFCVRDKLQCDDLDVMNHSFWTTKLGRLILIIDEVSGFNLSHKNWKMRISKDLFGCMHCWWWFKRVYELSTMNGCSMAMENKNRRHLQVFAEIAKGKQALSQQESRVFGRNVVCLLRWCRLIRLSSPQLYSKPFLESQKKVIGFCCVED